MPTPAWLPPDLHQEDRPQRWQIDSLWKPGNSINLAIGQGDLLATPLQVAVSYAAIANGGYLVTPHLGLQDRLAAGHDAAEDRRTAPRRLGISPSYLAFLRNALREAASTPAGTSYAVFGSYPWRWPARPARPRSPARATTPGMRASRRPTIPSTSSSCMIEQGGEGAAAAAPAARIIYNALYDVKGTVVGGVGRGD